LLGTSCAKIEGKPADRLQAHGEATDLEIKERIPSYQGSCHCRAVRFEVDLDTSAGTGKCNCTIRTMMRLWSVNALPERFRLLTGESELAYYQGASTRSRIASLPALRRKSLRMDRHAKYERHQVQ
jgi:hypothetical protein